MLRICVPDDFPAVLATSGVFPALAARATLAYFDSLPAAEDTLIERIGEAEAVLNIRSSSRFTARAGVSIRPST